MDFDLNDTQREGITRLRELLDKIATTEIIADLDRREEFPVTQYQELAQAGYTGLTIAPEYGGNPVDVVTLALVAEELGNKGNTLVAAWEPTVAFSAQAIQRFGTEEQRRTYLPGIADGTVRFAMALSEADAGSDLSHLATTATADGDDYVISGSKTFVTGADSAQYILIFARTADGPARSSLSMFIAPSDSPGITSTIQPKLCSPGVHLCSLEIDKLRLPADSMLGDLHGATRIVSGLLDNERILTGAKGVGIAQAALDMAFEFAQKRHQFGQPVIDFQAVGHVIADMAAQVEAARMLVLKAATLREQGRDCSRQASMAKLVGSIAGTRCAEQGMQVLGGYSYLVEYGMERLYREAKLYEIGGGTSQIQRNVILRKLRSDGITRP